MSWKDRAKEVKPSWKDRAIAVKPADVSAPEPEVSNEEDRDEPSAISDLLDAFREGTPFSGAAQKIGAGIAAGISEIGEHVGLADEKDLSQRYDEMRARQEAEHKERAERSPGLNLVGNVAGGAVFPAAKGGLAAKLATNAGSSFVDSATRQDSLDSAVTEGGKSAALSAALTSVPVVGKAIKRLIPGTEDAYKVVNKGVAKGASFMPFQAAKSAEIEDVLNNPAARRLARNTDIQDEVMKVADELRGADDVMKKAVGNKFQQLEDASLAVSDNPRRDLLHFMDVNKQLEKARGGIEEFGQQHSAEARRVFGAVDEILKKGKPGDLPIAKMGMDDLARVGKERTLKARRMLDDLTRNKDFNKMLKPDREAIEGLRDLLNSKIQNQYSGSVERAQADKLYSQFKDETDDVFSLISKQAKNKPRDVNERALERIVKTGTVEGKVFDKKLQQIQKYAEEAQNSLGKMPEVQSALSNLEKLKDTADMQRLITFMDRAGGGPTSQAINLFAQGAAASASGGLSLFFLPITNPAGWMRVTDAMDNAVTRTITSGAKNILQRNPALGAKIRLAGQDEETER